MKLRYRPLQKVVNSMPKNSQMPDVALEKAEQHAPLDWVGMQAIELPVSLLVSGETLRLPAKARAQVSLDLQASRGIHMSRLFLETQKLAQGTVNLSRLGEAVQEFLKTHKDLSSRALLEISFDLPVLRPALKSDFSAWRTYPVKLSALGAENSVSFFIEVLVTYSSTCPASAALARQMIQNQAEVAFGASVDKSELLGWLGTSQGIVATPHAQRSEARVRVEVSAKGPFGIVDLIDLVEEALQTPVQAAVKREDEQEFALRNGQNLMFCEDAARRVAQKLMARAEVLDYVAEFHHLESLHPHNAVSRVSAGKNLKHFVI